ncbi:MAG TPA: lipoprotein [Gammaproteobacteria bacterium]
MTGGSRRRAALALAIAAYLALAGCGQKGPLYLPGSPEDPAAAEPDDQAEDGDRERRDDD